MEFREAGFWEALKAGKPLARYKADMNGTDIYLTEGEYKALRREMDDAESAIRNLGRAKALAEDAVRDTMYDAKTAASVAMEEANELKKRADFVESFQMELYGEIDRLNDLIAIRNKEIAAANSKTDALEVKLTNTNGNGHFDFLKNCDPAVQRYAADFLKGYIPKPRTTSHAKKFDSEYHETPRQFDRLIAHLDSIPFLTEIHWHNALAKKNDVVGVRLEEETGRYWVDATYKCNNFNARMKLYTTARNEHEASFVGYCVGLALK